VSMSPLAMVVSPAAIRNETGFFFMGAPFMV
jgi:hypothetical protein